MLESTNEFSFDGAVSSEIYAIACYSEQDSQESPHAEGDTPGECVMNQSQLCHTYEESRRAQAARLEGQEKSDALR
jgi:hypothetical protein